MTESYTDSERLRLLYEERSLARYKLEKLEDAIRSLEADIKFYEAKKISDEFYNSKLDPISPHFDIRSWTDPQS